MVPPDNDRYNGWIFTICYVLTFLSAPVLYIGVVQASLLDKLGANATLASLPASAYMFGQISPLFFSWLVPHRLERSVAVWANLATASVIGVVFAVLALPTPPEVRIGAVVMQGLLQGFSHSTAFVFVLQCLRRGTTEQGLARALKRTFSATPLIAVAGSLGAQYLLNPGLPFLPYPYDFAALYLVATICVAGIALTVRGFRLAPLKDELRPALLTFMASSVRSFAADRRLLLLWFAYLLWYASLGITANLSLYTRQAMGREPKDFSGLIMAIRFGCKSIGGFFLGAISVRRGIRAGVLGATGLLALGSTWAWLVPGAGYLFAFGLLGAGELGGAYFPNYVSTLSTAAQSTRNLSMITLATPASSFSPVLHGALTDRYGFAASFAFSILCAAGALLLVLQAGPKKDEADGRSHHMP